MANTMNLIQDTQIFLTLFVSLTTVLGIFTGIINKMFSKKLKPIEDRLDVEANKSLEQSMLLWRYEIVTFASELHNGVNKSVYEFESIFTFIDEYEKAIKKLDVKNSLFEAEEEFIRKTYQNIKK